MWRQGGIIVCLVMLQAGAQVLDLLQLPGVGRTGVLQGCDDCSAEVQLNTSFPFGDYCHNEAYISVNGFITFGEELDLFHQEELPGTSHSVYFSYIVSPFWADGDTREAGDIKWEILSRGDNQASDELLTQISQFIEARENTNFVGNWSMIVNYTNIPPLLRTQPTNTFQVVLITDGTKSYAIFTYHCPTLQWGPTAVIGFNAAGDYYEDYNALLDDNNNTVTNIDCLAWPSLTNNLVFDLVPSPEELQCSVPTPEPPTSISSCKRSGYTECCQEACLDVRQECYCDSTCYFFNDCCRDINDICPRENFTLGETYLLVARGSYVTRMSVDGSRTHNLYTSNSSFYGGVTALDFDHRANRMYWSDTNSGTLNQAYLNGSYPEVIHMPRNPTVDDLAVDWISNKIYWTEEARGEVIVMDLDTRLTRTLVVNHDGAITRAIAVDPTTRYMYWSDWGSDPRIERAGMDGSNRLVLHDTNIQLPNGLTLDIPNQRIYWVDASLNTIEYSHMNGSGRMILQKRDGDFLFHPFAVTLAGDFLFWTNLLGNSVYSTHKDRPEDNIVQLNSSNNFNFLYGIEAISSDRQPQAENPCSTAGCNSSSLCLLSPTNPRGYVCVCADNATDCSDDTAPTPLPTEPPSSTRGSCLSAGYSRCCVDGSRCRGRDFVTGRRAGCTCDVNCLRRGSCCSDIILTCPNVYRLCSAAGYSQCCPAGSGCANNLSSCSCDEDCTQYDNCCRDTFAICHNPIPGTVVSLRSHGFSASELVINWGAPPSNGHPLSYIVTLTVASGVSVYSEETTDVIAMITGLEPGVPYYVSVLAKSGLTSGGSSDIIAFTRERAPSVGPTPTITWLSNSEMNVSWTPLTLEEARGFLTGYTVTYASIGRKKRQIEEGERMVAANESFVVLDGLNASQRQYLISVLGVNSAGSGVSSTRVNAPTSPGVYFQLHLLDIPSCEEWQSVSEKQRQTSIINGILTIVKEQCNTCNLKADEITSVKLALHCDGDQATATFRALLLGSPQQNELITNNLEKWVEEQEIIDFGDFTAKLNGQCTLAIKTFLDDFCTTEPPKPPSSPPPTKSPETMSPGSSEPSSNQGSDNTAAIVVPIVIILILLIVVAVILIVIVVAFRKRNTQKADPYLNFDQQQETSGTARLSQTLYDGENGENREKEFENPLYVESANANEEPEEITKTDLEREYLENPDVLK